MENGKMAKRKVKEYIIIILMEKIGICMMVNGKMGKKMAKVYITGQMEINYREYGRKIYKKVKQNFIQQMVMNTINNI